MSQYIGVVDDGRTVGGGYLYRVNYGAFAIPVESATPLTIAEAVDIADARLAAGNGTPEAAPVQVDSAEVIQFRRKYLDTTAALCELAGETYAGKLQNTDYERVVMKASTNPVAGVLTATLVYCRTVLREFDGPEWFENIEGM